jgi:hypothetical protein
MKRPFQTVTLFGILAIFACDSDDVSEIEKLPPQTQNGQHTFGCIINGKAFVAEGVPDAYASYQHGLLTIRGCADPGCVEITVHDPTLHEGTYTLPKETPDQVSDGARFARNSPACTFTASDEYTGTVQVTYFVYESYKWIVSGTFEFEAHSNDCNGTVTVTHGRFDLNFVP